MRRTCQWAQVFWYVTASPLASTEIAELFCFESTDGEFIKRIFGIGQHASVNAHMLLSISLCCCLVARGRTRA